MVLAADFGADDRQRAVVDQVAAEVHRNLAGLDDLALAGRGDEGLAGEVEVVADGGLDLVDVQVVLLVFDDVAGDALGEFDGVLLVGQRRVGDDVRLSVYLADLVAQRDGQAVLFQQIIVILRKNRP